METFSCRNPMPTFAVNVTFLLPDCWAETFKLPRSWQVLADHRQLALKTLPVAECSVVSMPCSQTSVWQTSTFTLTRAPLPALCPAADVILPPPHTHTHAYMDTHAPLLFNSPLATTFHCLHFSYCLKNNTRHLVGHSEYTHTHAC